MVKKNFYFDEDAQLMLKVAEGDKDAFNRVYKKYFRIVTDYATSVNGHANTSEDIAEEVFKRIWRQRAKYKPASTVKTYLFTFAGKVIREHQRRSRYQQSMLNNYASIMAERPDPEVVVQNIELTEIIEAAKGKLSEKQRQAIESVFYSNMSIDEAAELAGCSRSTFSQRVYDAKERLSVLLKQFRDY